MNELQVFQNSDFGSIRTFIEPDGKILFCGYDIACALGYKDKKDAINRHCRGVVKRPLIDSLGRTQQAIFIPEGDIYRLTARSQLPSAEKFERWVFDEVLPQIRKTGSYFKQALPADYLSALKCLVTAEEEKLQLTAQIEKDKPYVDFGKAVEVSANAVKLEVFAKTLCNTYGSRLGRNKLFDLLRRKGMLYYWGGCNLPVQRYINDGYFVVKESTATRGSATFTNYVTMITGKGQVYISKKIEEWLDITKIA